MSNNPQMPKAGLGKAPGPKPTNDGASLKTGYKKLSATDSYKCPSADAQSRNR